MVTNLPNDAYFQISKDVIVREEDFGGLVFLKTDNQILRLNSTAYEILRLIDKRSIDFVITSLSSYYQINRNLASKNILLILGEFIRKGIITRYNPNNHSSCSLRFPTSVDIDPSFKCNLNCVQCVVDANNCKKEILSFTHMKKILDELHELGVFEVTISGGEPLLYEHFFEACIYAIGKGFNVLIASNGTLIDKKVAKKIADIGIRDAQISIDGIEQNHDAIRGKLGAFKKAVCGIKNLISEDVNVHISTVVMKKNFNDIPHLVKLAVDLGAKSYRVLNFMPFGRGGSIEREILDDNEYSVLTKKMRKLQKESRIKIIFGTKFEFDRSFLKLSDFEKNYISCKAGKIDLCIDPDGSVYPCRLMAGFEKFNCGNIKISSLKDIWQSSEVLNSFRKIQSNNLKGKCKICKIREYCMGGCHVMAYKSTGDLLSPDPRCNR